MQLKNWRKIEPAEVSPLLDGFDKWVSSINAVTKSTCIYVNSKGSVAHAVEDKACMVERRQTGRLNALKRNHAFAALAEKLAGIDAVPVCIVTLKGPKIKRGQVIVKPLQNEKNEYALCKKAGDLGIGPVIYNTYSNNGLQMVVEEGLTIERLWMPLYSIKKLPALQFSRKLGELFGKLHHENIIYQDWQPNHIFYQLPSGRETGNVKLVDFGSASSVPAKYCDKEKEDIRRRVEDLLMGRGIPTKEIIKALNEFDARYLKNR
jgi:tRNA A-37 threonylcarbamoyl transferase component Bud32